MVTKEINLDETVYLYSFLLRSQITVPSYLIFRILSLEGQDGRYVHALEVNWAEIRRGTAIGGVTGLDLTPSVSVLCTLLPKDEAVYTCIDRRD